MSLKSHRQAIAATVWGPTSLSLRLGFRGLGRSSLVLYFEGMTKDTTYLHSTFRALGLSHLDLCLWDQPCTGIFWLSA